MIRARKISVMVCLLAMASFPLISVAQDRHIHVNGAHLTLAQIMQLDYAAGSLVPNGYYWLNYQTGAWGYEGNATIQGYLGQAYAYGNNPTGPGYNVRTPGGDLMHDGNCGYVAGVPVDGCP